MRKILYCKFFTKFSNKNIKYINVEPHKLFFDNQSSDRNLYLYFTSFMVSWSLQVLAMLQQYFCLKSCKFFDFNFKKFFEKIQEHLDKMMIASKI